MKYKTSQKKMSHNAGSFESFFEGWLVRQEHYLDELLTVQENHHDDCSDDDLQHLISRVLSHYHEYYAEKSRLANRNVFLAFSPTWFTPFERTFLWIAGFKPALVFRVVVDSVNDLTEDQSQRMDRLRYETKVEERALADELARIQESVAAPPIVDEARRAGQQFIEREYVVVVEDSVVETLKSEMETVLGKADMLRTSMAESVVGILSPIQNVRFLASVTQLQLKIRRLGIEKESLRSRE